MGDASVRGTAAKTESVDNQYMAESGYEAEKDTEDGIIAGKYKRFYSAFHGKVELGNDQCTASCLWIVEFHFGHFTSNQLSESEKLNELHTHFLL